MRCSDGTFVRSAWRSEYANVECLYGVDDGSAEWEDKRW